MNLVQQNKLFADTYVNDSNDVFEGINKWVRDTKKLQSQYQGRINNNEALTSTLTNILPEDLDKRINVDQAESRYKARYIREALSQIDDYEVKISVLQSLNASSASKNLVFKYHNSLSESQRARVRIVAKLIWYNLYPKKGR